MNAGTPLTPDEWSLALLASLPERVAVLDPAGVIVAANPAWEALVRESDSLLERCRPGANYLVVHRELGGDGAKLARQIATGVEGVLADRCSEFSIEYPCHGSKGDSGFLIRVTPLRSRTGGAVVMYLDITGRQQSQVPPPKEAQRVAETAALSRLNDASARLWRMRGLKEGLDEILGATIELLHADMGDLQLVETDNEGLVIAAQRGFQRPFLDFFHRVSIKDESTCARALRTGVRVEIEDIELDAAFARYRPVARDAGYRGVQSTPLIGGGGQKLGVISTHWRQPHRLDDQDERRLDLYARQAAVYIERCQQDEELNLRAQRLRAVLETAADAIITIDYRGLIVSVNRATERMFGYTVEELLGRNVSMLMPPPFREHHDQYLAKYHGTGERRVIGRGRELFGQRRDGTLFPMILAVSQIDHLKLFTGIVRDITERRELQQKLLDTAAGEQRRIAQELHDGIQQELTGLALFAVSLNEMVGRLRPAKGDDSMERLQPMFRRLTGGLTDVQRHVQELARGVMPVQIDAEGLQTALTELAERTAADAGVACAFHSRNTIRVSSNIAATHLFRVAQEAVNNALKHANATSIELSLSRSDHSLTLEVRDNGSGFDLEKVRATTPTMGLKTMEYRAGLVGGALQIERGTSGGTIVRCIVPVLE